MSDRLLVVANEYSSNARAIQRQINRVDLPAEYIVTSLESERTQDELYKKVRPGDLIVAAGGDGTAHEVGNMMLSPEARERGINTQPFLPVRGGNANDIATMINGRTSVRNIVKHGQLMELSPLQVTVEHNDKITTRYALGYVSVGGTAAASEKLNAIKSNSSALTRLTGVQFVHEALTSWLAIADVTREIYAAHEKSRQLPISDYLFIRGDRIAKIGRPHANLVDPEFEAIALQSLGKLHALRHMFALKNGKLPGEMMSEAKVIFTSSNARELPAQYDGEPSTLMAGSHVTVSIAPHSYTTLTTRLMAK